MKTCRTLGFVLAVIALWASSCTQVETEQPIADTPAAPTKYPHRSKPQPAAHPASSTVPTAPSVATIAAPTPTTYAEYKVAARSAIRDNDLNRAVDMWNRALSIRPAAVRPRIELARTLLSMRQLQQARLHAERAVKRAPGSSRAWNTLGRIELAENNLDAAVTSFQRAADENTENSYAWNNLGLSFMRLKRYDEAMDALEEATGGNSPKAYMWNNLGMAYEHLDRLDEARAAYRQAQTLGSGKAATSLKRLHGVVSVLPSDTGGDEPETTEQIDELDAIDAGVPPSDQHEEHGDDLGC